MVRGIFRMSRTTEDSLCFKKIKKTKAIIESKVLCCERGAGPPLGKCFNYATSRTKLQFIFKALKRHKTENAVFSFCSILFLGIAQVNVLCEGDYICFTSF